MSRIHVCLVSGQPIPNLIPLRMEELRPEKVVLLVSPDMAVQARRLREVIELWAIKVEERPIAPYDLTTTRDTCMNLLAELESEDVTLNVTGGTKIMALASFEVFREMTRPIIYVDTQDKRIQVLSPERREIPFKGVIKVKPYLAAYGQAITEHRDDSLVAKRKFLLKELVDRTLDHSMAIGIANRYFAQLQRARTFPLDVAIADRDLAVPSFERLLTLFASHGILEFRKPLVRFAALADVAFASGEWLEEYVYHVARTLNPTDLKMGLVVSWDEKGPEPPTNEYDVAFTVDNRLYLVECKTGNFSDEDDPSNENLIYKLESLRDAAGGLYGKAMLVSYRALTEGQKKRLKANRLAYCDGPRLQALDEKLRAWVR